MGASVLVKGGLNFRGGLPSTTSTSTKPVYSNQIWDSSNLQSPILHRLRGICTLMVGSNPRNRWNQHGDSNMMKIICVYQNTIQPKVDVDMEPKSTPLKNLGQK
jgi:hypothetical protein